MIAPRWKKVFQDIWNNKLRTLLTAVTIAVGVFAVGFVTLSFEMILTDMDADYQSVNPHGARIFTAPFDDEFLASLRKVPGVGQLEGRSQVSASLLWPDGRKIALLITGIPPLDEMKIDRLRPHTPGAPLELAKHQIFVERSVLVALPIKPGDRLNLELDGGQVRTVQVAELVHDVANFPYVFSNQVLAYADLETAEWLGGARGYTQAYLTVAENPRNEAHVRAVADAVAQKIERSGRGTPIVFVYQPGRHFASDITAALGAMMGVLGFLAVGLSTFLVVNTINALLAAHIRQVGMMKAIGARTGQLILMYLVLVGLYGLVALAIAAPLSAYVAYSGVSGIGQYLNFNPGPFRITPTALILQIAVALLVPIGAALLPVLQGTRKTVREAISSYGLGAGRFGASWVDRLVERVRGLPRPLLISIRNTFRRKLRLALTLSALVLAGGIFIGVFNLKAAMDVAIRATLGYLLTDVNVAFQQPYRLERIEPLIMSIPGVVKMESWGGALGELSAPGDGGLIQVQFQAPPAGSTMIAPAITAGRWLLPEDDNAIVIGNHLLARRPELKVGDTLKIKIDGRETAWQIVGTYRMAGNIAYPVLYTNREALAHLLGQNSEIYDARVVTAAHDLATQKRVGEQIEAVMKHNGIQVNSILYGDTLVKANTAQTDVLVNFLITMAVLIAVVGGLGLMSTMSINVIERTREIGVIRAVGASNSAVLQLVVVEGMMIGLISWALGALLAVPIGGLLANVVGVAFLRSPLEFVFAMDGFIIWLIMVVVISALASILPARGAMRLTVREVLAYE